MAGEDENAALMALYERLVALNAARNKQQVTLRLDSDVLDHFRAGGRFWQRRINAALRRAMEQDQAALDETS